MKIALLVGAIRNAGDFLIVDRCEKLLYEILDEPVIEKFNRNESLEENVDLINKCDCVVFAGGPMIRYDMYPVTLPLVDDLSRIKPPVFVMATGWWNPNVITENVFQYTFAPKMKKLLERASERFTIGCRDYFTSRVLSSNGYKSTMTGCSAWYDLNYVDKTSITNDGAIRKICISDPARTDNLNQFVDMLQLVRKRYPYVDIKVVFHAGLSNVKTNNYRGKNIYELLKSEAFEIVDISGGINGINIYDDCNLHIGYRVHSHLYNLSQRRRSILIEEDSRGTGANYSLGLNGIKAYDEMTYNTDRAYRLGRTMRRQTKIHTSQFVGVELKHLLDEYEEREFYDYVLVFEKMKKQYSIMKHHIETINNI